MELIFLFLVFLAVGLRGAEAMSLKGEQNGQILITCSHSNAYSNVKYFCRGACYDEDVLISTREKKEHSQGRYNIRDEGNTFYVTISSLKKDDEGTYWCGIDRVGIDTYNKVVLTVVSGSTDNGLQRLNSEKLVYIGAGLGVVVLALAIVLLIFFRHRKRDISTSSGKGLNTVYAAPSSLTQDAKHQTTTVSSTANKDEDTEGSTDSIVISSTIQRQDTSGDVTDLSKAKNQSDGLFYSSVSFSKRTDSNPVTADHAEVTYSTIGHTSTDKSSVYCNV
ncbi:CMRF35-like molecule 1 isoform X1 [Lates japonicus]|uniref:CMRF35-like molecule 1 isoform X1 n=1 Tax=Lates japonicus TaxID=270547 RepID=A0AAD3MWB5_LATJO|nr:CMRF35-like molecule 1 isoform X1 [Lates japonicus]